MARHGRSDDQNSAGGKGSGPNPTDRGKWGTKSSPLTAGHGLPIGVAVDGANRNDLMVQAMLQSLAIARP